VDDAAEVQVLGPRTGLELHPAALGHRGEPDAERHEQRVVRELAGQHRPHVVQPGTVERRRGSGGVLHRRSYGRRTGGLRAAARAVPACGQAPRAPASLRR
jgi:hypothetical protein